MSIYNTLRTSPQKLSNIDTDERLIKDVIVCQVGDIKDWRPWSINLSFLEDLVKFANKSKDGILSNYGHNWNNLGKRLGRMHNFRLEGEKVLADLKIFKSADLSPGNEKLGQYVLSLVEEDDKAIMNSIHFKEDYFYQLDSNNQEIKVWYWDDETGWINSNPELGKIYPKFEKLKYVDVVDEGAVTDSMFSSSEMLNNFLAITNHPHFSQLLESNYDKMTVLSDFFSKKTKPSFLSQMRSWLGKDTPGTSQQLESITQALSTKETQYAELEQKYKALQQSDAEHQTTIQTLTQQVEDLKAQAIALAAEQDGNDGGSEDLPLYMLDPINQKLLKK